MIYKEDDAIKNEMMKLYPFWNSLSEREKETVSYIASRCPICCEDVATIFVIHGRSDKQVTTDYIEQQYGFVIA